MIVSAFVKGLGIGLAVAAPVGPIGILCIQRTLAAGRLTGLVSGLGAAVADAAYGLVAAFGLSAIAVFLVDQEQWIRLGGGLFLCALALRILFRRIQTEAMPAPVWGKGAAFTSTLLLTLANPATILSFVAIFAGLGLAGSQTVSLGAVMVAGVFFGSAAWWLALSQVAGLVRGRVGVGFDRAINAVSATMLGGYGVYAVFSTL